jgi:hypothetical protein
MILQALATAATIVLVLRFLDRLIRPPSLLPIHREKLRRVISNANTDIRNVEANHPHPASPGVPGEGEDRDAGVATTSGTILASAALLVLFLFYPPLLAAWRTQFQPIELGMPLVVFAIMLMHGRRDAWLGVVVLLLLCTRESAPLAVAGLAIYAGLALRRWRLAIGLVIVAGAWGAVTMGFVMPHFRAGSRWPHTRWIDPGAMWDKKLIYLAVMLLSFGALPYLNRFARAATLAAAPGMILNLMVSRQTQLTFVGHYDAQTAPFLMIAAAHGMVTLVNAPWRSALIRRATQVSPLLCFVFFALTNAKTPFQLLHDWLPTPARLALASEARGLAKQYQQTPALSAWANLGPQVCHRRNYIGMRIGASTESMNEWAQRLPTGTILLVPSAAYPDKEAAQTRELIRANPHAQLAHEGKLVEAYVWNESAATRPAATRKAPKKRK